MKEPTGINLAKLAIRHSDGVILGAEQVIPELVEFARESGLDVLPYKGESIVDGSYIDDYNSFYDKL